MAEGMRVGKGKGYSCVPVVNAIPLACVLLDIIMKRRSYFNTSSLLKTPFTHVCAVHTTTDAVGLQVKIKRSKTVSDKNIDTRGYFQVSLNV